MGIQKFLSTKRGSENRSLGNISDEGESTVHGRGVKRGTRTKKKKKKKNSHGKEWRQQGVAVTECETGSRVSPFLEGLCTSAKEKLLVQGVQPTG